MVGHDHLLFWNTAMKHENFVKIYHHDTDCYGIVWHGAYFKWFEAGRIELSQLMGIDFKTIEKMGILMPVVEINCRYKSPARLLDEICITTELNELKNFSLSFRHTIKNIKTDNLIINAITTVVTADYDGKMHRKMPDYLFENYKKHYKAVL